MILVALPLATFASASRLRMASTLSLGMASFSRRMHQRWPSAQPEWPVLRLGFQNALLLHSIGAQDGGFLFALGGGNGSLLFTVCLQDDGALLALSFICFSMASWISRGG